MKSTSNTGSNTGANKPSTSRPSGSSSGTARSTAAKVTKPIFRAGYLNNPPPEYPRASKRRGEEGKVLLKVRVSAQGKPIKIQLHRSSGFKKLDKAAQKTVKRWRFVPAKQGNTPIAAWVIVPIEFNLR
ncbi:MAG: energy transducer TonB [Thiotrichaceae bacterium]|nr:energy transducer TonB [Thiotrichaceae bacterium]